MLLPSLDEIARKLGGEVSNGNAICPGPNHSAADRSLSVKVDGDKLLVHSFAGDDTEQCRRHVYGKLGLPLAELKAKDSKQSGAWTFLNEYIYRDADNQPHTRVRKWRDGKGEKHYSQNHWDGKQWQKGKPKGAKLPYRLPQLLAAPLSATVIIAEGEKCCEALARRSFVATTNSEGAAGGKTDPKHTKWPPKELNSYFKGRNVVLIADNDTPGRLHVNFVAGQLQGIAASVRVVDLAPHWPGEAMPVGADVADFLDLHDRAGAKLGRLIREAPVWEPPPTGTTSDDTTDTDAGTSSTEDDDETLIAELALMSTLAYAKRRKEAAKKLGVSVTLLDKMVNEARGDGEPEPALYDHWLVTPHEEPVEGDALLSDLIATLKRFVAISDEQALVVALWITVTWLHEAVAIHSPILLLTSPQPSSGKTTLLKLISFLVRRGLSTVSITGAALFRSIEKWQPSLIIDEADTAFVNNDDLKEVVNSGWTKGDVVIRCDPDTHDPRPYRTFCPKALGMIGRKLPPATLSRCFTISMQRKKPGDKTEDFAYLDDEAFTVLRSRLLRWSLDNAEALAKAKPGIPASFHNRVRANWWLPLAIAEQAGWKDQAHKAVMAVEDLAATGDPGIGIQLLSDIRDVFERLGADRVTTKELIAELAFDEDGPWHAYGKGDPITSRQVARLLKDFRRGYGIKPRSMRVDGIAGTPKGYTRADFEDDFEAYLPVFSGKIPSRSATPQQTSLFKGLDENLSATKEPMLRIENPPNPLAQNVCCGVADKNGGPGEKEKIWPVDAVNSASAVPPEPCAPSIAPGAEDHRCDHCHVVGDTQEISVGGVTYWLHNGCRGPFMAGRPPW